MPGFISLLGMVLVLFMQPALAEEDLWQGLAEGRNAALIRHAIAPGTGDPAGFELGDCSTQRTLSEEGRRQSRALGELFRAQGISQARVLSSRWCRCLETAELLGLGQVEESPPLDSFFGNRDQGPEQTRAARTLIREHLANAGTPLVLVTHQVNITALSDVYPASGEVIVVSLVPESDELKVEGRIKPEF
ncbi:histidine phosphatase family protein [Fodinicurvata halophila]|uniref:Histidine phosphatase family protein n=1 Tax=Fodinicurvata halophila TaxID=1419723 RepID=A0ABV8URR2_9PROT